MEVSSFAPTPHARIVGVDEVGRGPLAGPVVAAAVFLPQTFDTSGLKDSKKLNPHSREKLAARLLLEAEIGVAYVPASVIDAINIHHATLLAMRRAVNALPFVPDHAIFDGKFVPPALPCTGEAWVKGDQNHPAIAAASIIAKVFRDQMMAQADFIFPGYDFFRHAGYPTAHHINALNIKGLSPIHRRSYAPCRLFLSKKQG